MPVARNQPALNRARGPARYTGGAADPPKGPQTGRQGGLHVITPALLPNQAATPGPLGPVRPEDLTPSTLVELRYMTSVISSTTGELLLISDEELQAAFDAGVSCGLHHESWVGRCPYLGELRALCEWRG